MTACELNSRVDLHSRQATTNVLGENDYYYPKLKSLWAQIIPVSGTVKSIAGDMEVPEVSHKFIIRQGVVKDLSEDMYFIFKNQRYDIKYFMPNYKERDRVEIYCTLRKSGEASE